MGDSFQGGVDPARGSVSTAPHGAPNPGATARAGRGERRARVAIHGTNIEALTGNETFRIPIGRCSLSRSGKRIVVHDEQGPLTIWSDDDGFLDALARAQRGTLKEQVGRIRGAERRGRWFKSFGKALVLMAVLFVASVPFLRWAVRGGIPAITDRLGKSALEELDLPSGAAPTVERQLSLIADQLRPTTGPSLRSFRVLLADYADVHSFNVPPDAVVVTSGLICGAEDPNLVMAAVARELAHLENRDVCQCVADAVDWHAPLELLVGDTSRLRGRMLDFADSEHTPTFTPAQETAANERAREMLTRAAFPMDPGQDVASLLARLKQLPVAVAENGQPPAHAGKDPAVDWAKARAEACNLIGR